MKIKINRAWEEELSKYEEILNKYKAEYSMNGYGDYYAFIDIESLEELFLLAKTIGNSLIVDDNENLVTIYDDYIE